MKNLFLVIIILLLSSNSIVSQPYWEKTGEIIGVILNGSGSPSNSHNVGVTPRSISVSSRFWDWGTAMVYSALLFSLEEGPFTYTVRLSY